MLNDKWINVSFAPCPIGWRLVFKNMKEPKQTFIRPMAGWLTQKEVHIRRDGALFLDEGEIPIVRVIAADCDGSEIQDVTEAANFLGVLAPGVDFDPKQWGE